MNKFPLLNIANINSTVYLFCRDEKGKPYIKKDEMFRHYYYEPLDNGLYKGYGNINLKKIVCKKPSDVSKDRTNNSFESDIIYTKRYLIDNVEIIKAPIRWIMMDIEVKTDIFPDVEKADKPISCVSIYDNFENKGITFWLPSYKSEYDMIIRLAQYIKERQPDLLIAFNGINFDFPYIFNRFPDFAKMISPIGEIEYHNKFPMGISCVDYYQWDKKMTLNRRKQYTLDAIAEEEIGMKALPKVNFNSLDIYIRDKNIYDLKRMIAIERKKQYIPLFNDIRILSKCLWSDMELNSRIIDQLLLQEAKISGIILPKKIYADEREESKDDEFEGAYRGAFKLGRFKEVGKYDLSGAYLYAITDLCLDEINISKKENKDTLPVRITDRVSNEIKKILYIKQNSNAILPKLAIKLIKDKIKYKELKDNIKPNSNEFKDIENKYNAIKTIFLSAWGCIGNKGFRLHNANIAGMITSTIRDLLHYINDKLKEKEYEVIYCDTDGVFILDKGENLSILLNDLIQQWSMERFNKKSSISFEYEGHFKPSEDRKYGLFLLALCHYKGFLKTEKGFIEEEKGIEAKKKDSTPFMAETQRTAIDMILKDSTKEDLLKYKEKRIKEILSASLFDISLPAKIAPNKKYINEPIFARALRYAQENKELSTIKPGDLFYWIYTKSFGIEIKEVKRKVKVPKKEIKLGISAEWTKNKNGDYFKYINKESSKEKDVIAFAEDTPLDLNKYNIDWQKMIERNIIMKIDAIFNAMGWIEKEPTKAEAIEELKRRGLI